MTVRLGLRRLRADDGGATAIEHALLAGLIAVVIVGGAVTLGLALEGFYGDANEGRVEHIDARPAPE